MTELTPFERAVLAKSLAAKTVPDSVRRQLDHIRVDRREASPVGVFIHLTNPPDVVVEEIRGLDLQVGDVIADNPGLRHGLGFVVFVRDGKLDMLEGYTFGDEEWPANLSTWRLRSASEP